MNHKLIYVVGKQASEGNNSAKFTAYVSPYFQVSNGGAYTKHIYSGSQRIASKLGNENAFGADPRRVEQAGGLKITDLQADLIESRFTALGHKYEKPREEAPRLDSTGDSEEREKFVFFYHPDQLNSTNFVTDIDGNAVQFVSYIPYGEVFVEERNSSFSSSYLFNAKELDNETGLYYYGARYLDPQSASWLSVDPLFEKYPGISPYSYCVGNPVRLVDPDGRDIAVLSAPKGAGGAGHMGILIQDEKGMWRLYSKNGTNEHYGIWGANVTKENYVEGGKRIIDNGQHSFVSVSAFLKDDTHNKDSEGNVEYTEAYVLKCTEVQDNLAVDGAKDVLNEDYNLVFSNCAQTVQSALKNAGFDDGSKTEHLNINVDLGTVFNKNIGLKASVKTPNLRPNVIYEQIKRSNPNGTIFKVED